LPLLLANSNRAVLVCHVYITLIKRNATGLCWRFALDHNTGTDIPKKCASSRGASSNWQRAWQPAGLRLPAYLATGCHVYRACNLSLAASSMPAGACRLAKQRLKSGRFVYRQHVAATGFAAAFISLALIRGGFILPGSASRCSSG